MKRMLKTLLALTASAVLWAGQANAVLIDFDATDNGDGTVSVDVNVSDLAPGELISAFDMDILFDDMALSLDFVTMGTGLGGPFEIDPLCLLLPGFESCVGAYLIGSNILDIFQVSYLTDAELLGIQGGLDFTLFTMTFDLNPGYEDFGDFEFLWDEFNDVKCEENRECFPVSVPEPGTLGLLGLGLLGLGLARRRRML